MSAFTQITVTKDGFAFNPTTGESYTLNSCGHIVIQRLQQGDNPQQIAHFLADHFGIPSNTAERDIAEFFQQLNILGLTGASK